jgi:hypothetical protein
VTALTIIDRAARACGSINAENISMHSHERLCLLAFCAASFIMSNSRPISGVQMQAVAEQMPPEPAPKLRGKLRLMTLSAIDGRTRSMQRVRSLMAAIEADLGGSDHLTLGQRQLCQRAAVLGALIEDLEARWAAGEVIGVGDYLAAINAQRRVLATLGLQRVARDVTDLNEYLAGKASHPPEAEP